jgi:hypothetical protein
LPDRQLRAVVNSATHDLLVGQRGWSMTRWRDWLVELVERELFG